MMRLLKIYMQRPELVALLVLVIFTTYFTISSGGLFLSFANVRGIFSLYPELAILALGFGLLMISGEFDLSIGSMMGLCPMALCTFALYGVPFWPAFVLAARLRLRRPRQRHGNAALRHPELHHDAGHAVHAAQHCGRPLFRRRCPVLPRCPKWAFSEAIGIFRVSTVWLIGLAILCGCCSSAPTSATGSAPPAAAESARPWAFRRRW